MPPSLFGDEQPGAGTSRAGWDVAFSARALWFSSPSLGQYRWIIGDAIEEVFEDGSSHPESDWVDDEEAPDPDTSWCEEGHCDPTEDGFGHTVVACGDVSGDGLPDVAVARAPPATTWARPSYQAWDWTGEWSVSLAPDFRVAIWLAGGPTSSRGTPCGDLDGNGVAELCVDTGIWYGPLSDGQAPGSTWASADALLGVDLDGDGAGELLVASGTTLYHLSTLPLGVVDLASTAAASTSLPDIPAALAVGDLDGDGTLDLAVGLRGGGVLVGDADLSTFSARTTLPGEVLDLAVGDFDGDGQADLAVGGGSLLTVWHGPLGIGDLLVTGATRYHGLQYPDDDLGRALDASDMDGDGTVELAVSAPQEWTLTDDDSYEDEDGEGREPYGRVWWLSGI